MPSHCHACTQHTIILSHLHSTFRYRHIFTQHVITLSLSSHNRPIQSYAFIQHAITMSRVYTTCHDLSYLHTIYHNTIMLSHNMPTHCNAFTQHAITLSRLHTTCQHTVTSSYNMPTHCHAFTRTAAMTHLFTIRFCAQASTIHDIAQFHLYKTLIQWHILKPHAIAM